MITANPNDNLTEQKFLRMFESEILDKEIF